MAGASAISSEFGMLTMSGDGLVGQELDQLEHGAMLCAVDAAEHRHGQPAELRGDSTLTPRLVASRRSGAASSIRLRKRGVRRKNGTCSCRNTLMPPR